MPFTHRKSLLLGPARSLSLGWKPVRMIGWIVWKDGGGGGGAREAQRLVCVGILSLLALILTMSVLQA